MHLELGVHARHPVTDFCWSIQGAHPRLDQLALLGRQLGQPIGGVFAFTELGGQGFGVLMDVCTEHVGVVRAEVAAAVASLVFVADFDEVH